MRALILLIFAGFWSSAFAGEISHDQWNQLIIPGSYFEIAYSSETDPWRVSDFKTEFKPVTSNIPVIIDSTSAWFRFSVRNDSIDPIPAFFNIHNPTIHSFRLYELDLAENMIRLIGQNGSVQPYAQTDFSSGHGIDMTLSSGSTAYLLHVESPLVRHAMLSIWPDKQAFQAQVFQEKMVLFLTIGVETVLVCLNISLFTLFKRRLYFYYALWMASMNTMFIFNYGVIEFAPGSLRELAPWIGTLSIPLAQFSAVLFIKHYFNPRSHFIRGVFNVIALATLAVIPLVMASTAEAMILINILNILVLPLFLGYGIYRFCRRPSWHLVIFCASFSVFTGFFLVGSLGAMGLIDIAIVEIFPVGSVLEHLLMTFAIAYRFKRTVNQNTHFTSEMRKLLYPHQVRQLKDFRDLEKTMPTGSATACVIAFDIQNSTALGEQEAHQLFSQVIKQCHSVMLSDYQEKDLSASAYLIKEMGDGFLCSIGFPFRCEGEMAVKAVELAFSFQAIFNEATFNRYRSNEVYCALGISFGNIQGFYPVTGIKHYDLYGDSIVKAKRYESFRYELLKSLESRGNTIIIQQQVYDMLGSELQQRFMNFELTEKKVRDDPKATRLYYQIEKNGPTF